MLNDIEKRIQLRRRFITFNFLFSSSEEFQRPIMKQWICVRKKVGSDVFQNLVYVGLCSSITKSSVENKMIPFA